MRKLKVKIYADGANINDFKKLKKNKNISGFTTNPSLMRAAGVKNYVGFAHQVLKLIKTKPVSFEIFADDKKNIEKQANLISGWGKNVYVKIPIINTKKKFNDDLIGSLNKKGVKINVTAVFTINQTKKLIKKIGKKTDIIISIFAGRIADSGIDPVSELEKHVKLCKKYKNVKILWASVREPFNLIQANDCGCHIITIPPKILDKLKIFGKNLETYSQETVKDFYLDAKASRYKI